MSKKDTNDSDRRRHASRDETFTRSVKSTVDDAPGRFAYERLDRVIHEKARLSIVTSLATHPGGLIFNDLKDLCALTDGNLSRHLQILSEAGLIRIWKGFKDNRPQTLCVLTEEGRKRFIEYITVLENIVTDAVGAEKIPVEEPKLEKGWSPA
ncbi:MAG: transcriptional regulator [Planctomycetes bacterium]|nr:transcriptional regulator [Planctomycetota bacterium]